MKRKFHYYHEYRGHTIWRNTGPGYRLRWYSVGIGSADTLNGMKRAIKDKTHTP